MEILKTDDVLENEGEIEANVQSAEAATQDATEDATEEVNELNTRKLELEEKIAMLETELEKRIREADRRLREYGEFRELFPKTDAENLPSEVTTMVESGVPLCAAYALYEKRLQSKSDAAAQYNQVTKANGFGSVGRMTDEEFYSPDEVRAMTGAEVRKNYQKIINSMKNWY